MKNKSLIIILAIFIAVIALAAFLYPKLSETHTPISQKEQEQVSNKIESPKTSDFTVYDTNGNKVKLSDFFGKPIVLNFWATWCEPCKSELPAFDMVYQKHKDDVAFLMVNLTDGRDSKSSVESFIKESGFSFPVYFDLDFNASYTYGIYSIPETLFINADGTLFDRRVGAMSEYELENYITNIKGE